MPTTTRPLTARQQELLDLFRQHCREHGLPPTLRWLAKRMGGVAFNSIVWHQKRIEKKGHLRLRHDQDLGITINFVLAVPPGHCRACGQTLDPLTPWPGPDPEALSTRQQALLSFIRAFCREEGTPPTNREMADFFGLKSVNGTNQVVAALVRKGFLHHRGRYLSRPIHPAVPAGHCKACGQPIDLDAPWPKPALLGPPGALP